MAEYAEDVPCHGPATERWLNLRAAPLKDAGGAIIGLVFSTRDITERVLAESNLRATNQRLQSLLRVAQLLRTHIEVEPLMAAFVDLIAEVFQADCVTLMRLHEVEQVVQVAAANGASENHQRALRIPVAAAAAAAARFGVSGTVDDIPRDFVPAGNFAEILAQDDLRSLLWAGIQVRGQLVGSINVYAAGQPRLFTPAERELLETIAPQLSLALENAELYAEQQHLAITDGLTGLTNRRRFDQELARELRRAARSEHSTALILIDIDNFKRYNDTHGHLAGDQMLKTIAALLRQSVRAEDTAARYGGEEFALILPESDEASALAAAERVRLSVVNDLQTALSQVARPGTDLPATTVSLGVALAPAHAGPADALVQAADAALYQAKAAGKNCVVLYAPA